ncbi:MAG: PucR family transcriptional regulator [Clostridiaceae bacterium]
MDDFSDFLQELSKSLKIKFNLISEYGDNIFVTDDYVESSERISVSILLGRYKANINLSKDYEAAIEPLKYIIENKYKEFNSVKEQVIIDMLNCREDAFYKMKEVLPNVTKGYSLLLVSVKGNKYEALNIIKQLYSKQDVISVIFKEMIVVVGAFKEPCEHARSIRDAIVSDLYSKCYVTFGDLFYDGKTFKKAYENAVESMILRRRFKIKDEVLHNKKLLFEKVVYNVDNKLKEEFLEFFEEKFNHFDTEIINTIDEFIKCNLNVSDCAKKMYIHRNTLVYRLDKINKEMGLDIRKFKEAALFFVAFLVWKEKKQ